MWWNWALVRPHWSHATGIDNGWWWRWCSHIFHCTCAKWPYFHFRSKIWRHHHVSRPWFPVGCENLHDLRTFKAAVAYFIFAWIFRTSWPKMLVLGGCKIRERCDIDPLTISFFGGSYVCANFGENRSRNATVRVIADGYTDWHWQTQTDFIICPMLYAIAMGQIIKWQLIWNSLKCCISCFNTAIYKALHLPHTSTVQSDQSSWKAHQALQLNSSRSHFPGCETAREVMEFTVNGFPLCETRDRLAVTFKLDMVTILNWIFQVLTLIFMPLSTMSHWRHCVFQFSVCSSVFPWSYTKIY